MGARQGDGPYIDAPCKVCGYMMVSQRRWNAADAIERKDMEADGYVRQGVGLVCSKDYARQLYQKRKALNVDNA